MHIVLTLKVLFIYFFNGHTAHTAYLQRNSCKMDNEILQGTFKTEGIEKSHRNNNDYFLVGENKNYLESM